MHHDESLLDFWYWVSDMIIGVYSTTQLFSVGWLTLTPRTAMISSKPNKPGVNFAAKPSQEA